MKIRLGKVFLATGALLLAVTSACTNNDADPPAAESPSRSAISSGPPTSSPSPSTPSEEASAAATDMIRTYVGVLDDIRADTASDLTSLEAVATSVQLNALRNLISRQQEQGQRQVGETAIVELTVQSVSLDNSDPSTGRVPAVVVDVCWDVSKVDLVDASGSSVVPPNRPDTGWTRYTVANYQYAVDPTGGWRVASGQDLEQAPCSAS